MAVRTLVIVSELEIGRRRFQPLAGAASEPERHQAQKYGKALHHDEALESPLIERRCYRPTLTRALRRIANAGSIWTIPALRICNGHCSLLNGHLRCPCDSLGLWVHHLPSNHLPAVAS